MKLPFLAEGEAFWLAHFSKPECGLWVLPNGVLVAWFPELGAENAAQIQGVIE